MQTLLMAFFAKVVQSFYSLIIFTKKSFIDVWKDFKYVSDHEKLQLIMVVTRIYNAVNTPEKQ